jgi:hypothetical protein
VLVSFDVVSLFTKIPVELAIKVATKRLRQDATLLQRTPLPVEDIMHGSIPVVTIPPLL